MFGGPLEGKNEEQRCNYLMLWVGEKGINIYSTWNLQGDDRKTLPMYFDEFEQYCKSKHDVIYARYKFKCRTQSDDETFEQFYTYLKVLFNYFNELAIVDGLIYKGLLLVILRACRKEMLERTHESHLGMVKCKAKSREVMFWPSI